MSEKQTERDEATSPEPEWWETEGLPWAHKPTREELWCYGLLMVYSVWSLVMMPLRAWLLTVPVFSAILNGSRTATAMVGAFTQTGNLTPFVGFGTLALSVVSAVKWDLLYWWAGKLWGQAFIASVSGKKGRGKQISEWLERIATRYPALSMFVTYLPIPFTVVVYVVLGAARFDWRKFLALDLVCSALFNTGYFFLGWFVGQPAVDLLKVYGKYATYIAIAIAVVTFVVAYRRQSAAMNAKATAPTIVEDAVPPTDLR